MNGIKFLERRQRFVENKIGIDYCFVSGTNNLITLQSESVNSTEVDKIDNFLRLLLSTITTVQETPTPKEIGEWKEFSTVDFTYMPHYSFKYPPNWELKSGGEGCGPVFAPIEGGVSPLYWLTICGPYVNESDTKENLAQRSVGQNILISRVETLINNHPSIKQKVNYIQEEGNERMEIQIYVEGIKAHIGVGTLGIYFYDYTKETAKINEHLETLDQILSTIKFLD